MNIDNIENDDSFETDSDKVLKAILGTVVENNALLKTIIDSQIEIMQLIRPNIDTDKESKEVLNKLSIYLADMQAQISRLL